MKVAAAILIALAVACTVPDDSPNRTTPTPSPNPLAYCVIDAFVEFHEHLWSNRRDANIHHQRAAQVYATLKCRQAFPQTLTSPSAPDQRETQPPRHEGTIAPR